MWEGAKLPRLAPSLNHDSRISGGIYNVKWPSMASSTQSPPQTWEQDRWSCPRHSWCPPTPSRWGRRSARSGEPGWRPKRSEVPIFFVRHTWDRVSSIPQIWEDELRWNRWRNRVRGDMVDIGHSSCKRSQFSRLDNEHNYGELVKTYWSTRTTTLWRRWTKRFK